MDWYQLVALVLPNIAIILWFRAESRSDWRHLDAKMDAMQKETNSIITAIREDIKDFHGRLCAIEEKNKKG